MLHQALTLSDDQAVAYDSVASVLAEAGIDIADATLSPQRAGQSAVLALTGKAGSGKTLLLAELVKALTAAGVEIVSADWEGRRRKDRRTLAILAPTNKAASVLRMRGVPATTIHRILYTPVYDPEYERIAAWLTGQEDKPTIDGITETALERARLSYGEHASIPAALAAAGLRGSDFITGWKRREEPLDIGLVDEASMLDDRQFEDLKAIFPTLLMFGDPAQLAPVNQSGRMVFDTVPAAQVLTLDRIHRQEADSPILDLAHALADPALEFGDFEDMVRDAAGRDDRVRWAERVEVDLMARSPVLVWRNATRIRLIQAFRAVHGAPEDALLPGEPLVCDGIELPMKHRRKRLDLEARGLIKGAQVIYLGPGRKPGFSRLHVVGAPEPQVSAASIVKIEKPGEDEPFIPFAAHMGAAFLHGAAVTIHKAQGSQWEDVQVFSPDLYAAARAGRSEAGQPLWKRLAYVAITRAQARLHWVVRNRLARPKGPLTTDDLAAPAAPLALEPEPEAEFMTRILITGASSGIGRAVAELFLEQGWTVGLLARREEALRAVARDHEKAVVLPADVTDAQAVEAAFAAFDAAAGGIDVLFNNAGIFQPPAPIDRMALADWDAAVAVNLTGMVIAARAAFARMRAQGGGRIINNGSVSAHAPRPGAVSYTVTKHAITGLTRQLALDGRDLGIACGQIDIGNAESEIIAALKAANPDTPTMAVADAARSVWHMATMPPEANVLFMTVMANRMPYVGRG